MLSLRILISYITQLFQLQKFVYEHMLDTWVSVYKLLLYFNAGIHLVTWLMVFLLIECLVLVGSPILVDVLR